jgi:hypothetical protein
MRAALLQTTLKVEDARFEFFDAATLPVNRLEKAVERLPDVFGRHGLSSP